MTLDSYQPAALRNIRCTLMRGGTSKGPFFLASDLPQDPAAQEEAILQALGAMTASRIDGVGGQDTLSNKIAVVSPSTSPEADVDYMFFQAKPGEYALDRSVNCGNIMSGVGPFALERGLVKAQNGETVVRIRNLNTNALVHAVVQSPGGRVTYCGNAAIDGVAGTAAPILMDFRGVVGSKTGKLLPTGFPHEDIEGITVTCIDVAVPMILLPATELGLTGDESPATLAAMPELLARLERIRCIAGERMGLGDVSQSVMPKLAILSQATSGGTIKSRYFTPKSPHTSHAVTGALCIGAACLVPGSIAAHLCELIHGGNVQIEHPTGSIKVALAATWNNGHLDISRAALVRTARKLFDGEIFVPVSTNFH